MYVRQRKVVGMEAHKLRLICSVCDASFSFEMKIILTGAPVPSRPDGFSTHNAWQSLPVGDLSRSIPLLRDFVSWFVSVYGFVSVSDAISFSAQHRKDAD